MTNYYHNSGVKVLNYADVTLLLSLADYSYFIFYVSIRSTTVLEQESRYVNG